MGLELPPARQRLGGDVVLSSRMDAKAQNQTGPAASNLPGMMNDLAISASVVSAAILVPGCNP
jgi:hypothetical protein